MKVRAIELGYYEHARRKPGDVFYLKPYEISLRDEMGALVKENGKFKKVTVSVEEQFSDTWMEKVEDEAPPQKARHKSTHRNSMAVSQYKEEAMPDEPAGEDSVI